MGEVKHLPLRERERERERETERERERQRERQRDRETDRQTDRQTADRQRQTDRQTDRDRQTHRDIQTDTQTDTQTETQIRRLLVLRALGCRGGEVSNSSASMSSLGGASQCRSPQRAIPLPSRRSMLLSSKQVPSPTLLLAESLWVCLGRALNLLSIN